MYIKDAIKVGEIFLNDEVMISDPCYGSGVWCNLALKECVDGLYKCFIKIDDNKQVMQMIAIHENYEFNECELNYRGEVCVDSGTMSITDMLYYTETHSETDVNDEWYVREVCDWANNHNTNIADNRCFMSLSGYGDGQYGVYTIEDNDKTYAICVDFN